MSQPIKLSPAMGPVILKHLSQFGALPEHGILAGQAVDSAITDLFGKGGGVYNDLDIFRTVSRLQPRKHVKIIGTAGRSRISAIARPDTTYGLMQLVLQTAGTYDIASVSRKDMLNFVNCTAPRNELFNAITPQRVISGFDLNCVRVAVDLATGLLYWDKHYEDFVASRQLKIVMMHTPWHTFGRLCKKMEELPSVYTNLDQAAIVCTAFSNSKFLSELTRNGDVSLQFGHKYFELMQKYGSSIEPYFSIEASTHKDNSAAARAAGRDTVTLYKFVTRGQADPKVQAQVDRLGVGSLFFTSRVVEHELARKSASVQLNLQQLTEHRERAVPKLSRNSDFVLAHLNLFGTGYLKGQALVDVSDKVSAFLKKHRGFESHLFGLTLAEQGEAINRVTRIAAEYGQKHWDGDSRAALGALETQLEGDTIRSDEKVYALLDAQILEDSKPFKVTALALPVFNRSTTGILLQELLTPKDLKDEGRQMEHCVGGYSHAVRSGRSRILRIRTGTTSQHWSTAEISLRTRKGVKEWAVVQHRAGKNRGPIALNQKVLADALAYLTLAIKQRTA